MADRVARFLLPALWLLGSLAAHAEEPTPAAEKERLAKAKTMFAMKSVTKQQKALHILGGLHLAEAGKLLLAQFDRLEKGKLPLTLWLDLFEAAAQSSSAPVRNRLAKHEANVAAAADPLVRFRECLEGGDADNGRDVFEKAPEAGCIRCHSVNGNGGKIGPELAGLGLRTERIYILESIIVPNANIVMGYENVLLTLKNGEQVNGLLNLENRDEVTLISLVDGTRRKIKSSDIVSKVGFPSAMPPIFGQALSKRQIRDLVEFIATTEPQ